MKGTEKEIETYLGRGVTALDGICYKFTSPNRRFVPDRLCTLPFGLIWFVECKRPGGRVHPGQVREMVRLQNLGHKVDVVESIEEVDRLLNQMAELIRHEKSMNKITMGDFDAL